MHLVRRGVLLRTPTPLPLFMRGTGCCWPPYDPHATPPEADHWAHHTLRLLLLLLVGVVPGEAAQPTVVMAPSWVRHTWAAVRWGRTWAVVGACCPACCRIAVAMVVDRRDSRAGRRTVGRHSAGRRWPVRRGRQATGKGAVVSGCDSRLETESGRTRW